MDWYQHTSKHINTPDRNKIAAVFAEYIFKWIFLNENLRILLKISLKCVPNVQMNQQYSSIGSDSGMAPTRRQAIIWTNNG